MPHIGFSMRSASIGILTLEWTVFPPGSKVAAIPDYANAIAICFLHFKDVLPVPPGASKNSKSLC